VSDLAGAQQAVTDARAAWERARLALFAATQERRALGTRIAAAERAAEHAPHRLNELRREDAEAARRIETLEAELRLAASRKRETEDGLASFADPRRTMSALGDQTPFLLFPVRLETRFKAVKRNGAVKNQLWVRVYPDDCLIDAFEPMLSAAELANARRYWIDWWCAAGEDAGRRAAWRALVASHGSGRAAWILTQFEPANPDQEPARIHDSDVVLVVPTDRPLEVGELPAVSEYWTAVWRAGGDATLLAAARDALIQALGHARAEAIQAGYQPVNLGTPSPAGSTLQETTVQVAILQWPPAPATQQDSWSHAPHARLLPDRFVFLGYQGEEIVQQVGEPIPYPLVCGPDPTAPPENQLSAEDGGLGVPEEMRWMVDFERAVSSGMGFKIDLSPAHARMAFDRIIVLGVRLASDAEQGRLLLEEHLSRLQATGLGMSLLGQGSATNNTDSASSAFSPAEDAEASFEVGQRGDLIVPNPDPDLRSDGQWLASYLGIDHSILNHTGGADGTDQLEARAMNTALWPATLGYFLETMMHPLFEPADIELVRSFFTQFVSGRGAIPALRLGRQPYGILPATVFSRMTWRGPDGSGLAARGNAGAADFLGRLTDVLRLIGADWTSLLGQVSAVGTANAGGDPHQVLLDVLGLHPTSVEYHQRYAESKDHLYNVLNLDGTGDDLLRRVDLASGVQSAAALLQRLGYTGETMPDLFERYFLSQQNRLTGPLIDDRPLSERERLRSSTNDGRNYLEWLAAAATRSLETLRREDGFPAGGPPTALLYLCLRHALLLSFWRTSTALEVEAGVLEPAAAKARNREAPFVHVKADGASESRWLPLYTADSRITGHPTKLVAEHIVDVLGTSASVSLLDQQIRAIRRLADAPTAWLERAFAEHLDCCTYRHDAWMLGLVNYRLARLRGLLPGAAASADGIYLGAYGYLHDVRSEQKNMEPVTLPADLAAVFGVDSPADLVRDSTNGGYLPAPSPNHAVTAAVLRSGYLANADERNADAFRVDLSSARVRTALAFLEGMRGGQNLAALLGYRLERALHDSYQMAEVDSFVLALRRAFPLAANKMLPTIENDPTVPIEALEARNVVDGLSLVEYLRRTGNRKYPFGKELPAATAAQASAIEAAIGDLVDVHDAIADLGLAESVHQAAQGNFDRAAGNLDSFSRGSYPPDPDVIRTPRGGRLVVHRFALHLETGVAAAPPVIGVGMTPRARAARAVNRWLAAILPPPGDVACNVSYFDHGTNAVRATTVTQAELGLQPIDLLHLLQIEGAQAMTELDDRVIRRIVTRYGPRPDADIRIRYADPVAGGLTFFEVAPLVRHLRGLLFKSRPLRATDLSLGGEANRDDDATARLDRSIVAAAAPELGALRDDAITLRDSVDALPPGVDGWSRELGQQIDGLAAELERILEGGSRYGLPNCGWGFVREWTKQQFSELFNRVGERVTRWTDRLARFDALVDVEYPALPAASTAADRIALLRLAELEISTQVATISPLTPAALLTDLSRRRANFNQKLTTLRNVLGINATTVGALYDAVEALLPINDFDWEALDLRAVRKAMVSLGDTLRTRATALADDLATRIAKVEHALTSHDATADPVRRVSLLTEALKAVFGDSFTVVPEFTLSAQPAAEVDAALADSHADALLRHAVTLHEFPVDDWLYGVARIRPAVRDWEQTVQLGGALRGSEPELVPIQLPYRPHDLWFGLEVPSDLQGDALAGDRLLYTAHYAGPLDASGRRAGLLLDEWTETLPTANETIGVVFNDDRPDCEAPQSLLLVVPPVMNGSWVFRDLVDAVDETFALARTRAVEPAHLDKTAYATFLPAIMMAATWHPISITTPLSLNNQRADARLDADG
jgi:hypothetical protein